jgi:uncharacterized protein YdeI (YjbR/CyaY-like superfamily)
MPEPTFFESQEQFRQWLMENHDSASEVYIGMYRKTSRNVGITYNEALNESLCFGWIDGVRRKVDDESFAQRFTPRRKGSNWSAVNIRRFHELRNAGRIHPAGQAAFDAYDGPPAGYSFAERGAISFPDEFESELRANAGAWAYWESRPPGYRRMATFWVMSAKQEATRRRRLESLIADSAAGKSIGPLRRNT